MAFAHSGVSGFVGLHRKEVGSFQLLLPLLELLRLDFIPKACSELVLRGTLL